MNTMKEFFSAALPLVLTGLPLAVLAASCSSKKRRSEVQGKNIAVGAGLGLVLGVVLNSCGLWENHFFGLILGPLWGMALGSLYKRDESNDT